MANRTTWRPGPGGVGGGEATGIGFGGGVYQLVPAAPRCDALSPCRAIEATRG